MSDTYLRLAEPPMWSISYPTCSACELDLDLIGADYWLCHSCGTTWGTDASDGDEGELHDGLTGPAVPNDDAWRVANPDLPAEERDERVRALLVATAEKEELRR